MHPQELNTRQQTHLATDNGEIQYAHKYVHVIHTCTYGMLSMYANTTIRITQRTDPSTTDNREIGIHCKGIDRSVRPHLLYLHTSVLDEIADKARELDKRGSSSIVYSGIIANLPQ